MSRTHKTQAVFNVHRKPRGKKQIMIACEDEVPPRKGAIPPDAWDDLPIGNESHKLWKICFQMSRAGASREEIEQKLKNRFKRQELNEVLKWVFRK